MGQARSSLAAVTFMPLNNHDPPHCKSGLVAAAAFGNAAGMSVGNKREAVAGRRTGSGPSGAGARRLAPVWFVFMVAIAVGCLAWTILRATVFPPGLAAHAALMLSAWGVLLPAGSVLARYHKVRRGQDFPTVVNDLFWWDGHRLTQYAGILVATAGFAAALHAVGDGFGTTHARLGLGAMAIGWGQVVSGVLRGTSGGPWARGADPANPATWGGDHYLMSRRRLAFEGWHKAAGWVAALAAYGAMLLGADFAGSPAWLMATIGALQGATLCGIADGMLRGRWVDTYHALWGPDPHHPGNARSRRVSAGPSRRPRSRSPR